jgi:uncharacterized tellurite resistance protein B-like protein
MASRILKSIREFIEGNRSVRRVADDSELTAELVLLVRMMFADGELKREEMENFTRICANSFGIPREDVGDVLKYLRDFGYETGADNAASIFAELEFERKQALLLHMLAIAKSDDELHGDEAELIRRTAAILGLTAAQLRLLRTT